MADVDISPAEYRREDSRVLDLRKGGSGLVAVVDGAGSWGSGVEAASWMREELLDRWKGAPPLDAKTLSSDVAAAAKLIPEELRDGEFGDSFSFAAAMLSGDSVQIVAAGRFGAFHVCGGQAVPLFSPGTWVMEQVAAGILTVAEALSHPLRNVCTGPHISSRSTELFVNQPILLRAGESVLIVELALFQKLLELPVASWRDLSARQLQEFVLTEKGPKSPVVKVYENVPVA